MSLALVDVRPKLLAVLAPASDTDPAVIDVMDAVVPPAYMIGWGKPWITPIVVGGCNWQAKTVVLCIAGRLVPGAAIDTLEGMVASALVRLKGDSERWPVETVDVPERIDLGGITYLAARITLIPTVTT